MASISPLIGVDELHQRLGDDELRIFDCRFSLQDPSLGERQYREGHVPGADYADLDRHLADLTIAHRGRHPLPDRETFIRWLESRGVGDNNTVVCYDDAGGAIAARLWWMAGWVGLAARVLDGGLSAWHGHGLPLRTDEPRHVAARITRRDPGRDESDVGEVMNVATGVGDAVLIDARDASRYAGEKEPLDPVAGHVPGALNAPFAGNLDTDRCYLPPDRLRERFENLAGGRDPSKVIHMCGSGVTACHNLLAMEVAGLSGSRLFPGSWSEWVDDRDRPVATGKDR